MRDWVRSVSTLVLAFVGVSAFTLWVALLLAPDPMPGPSVADATASARPVADGAAPGAPPIPGLGGTLTMRGDHDGTIVLTSQAPGERYGLQGNDARLFFDVNPFAVAQVNVGGLSFFPNDDDCTVTPLDLETAVGVAKAKVTCAALAEVRGKGEVAVSGTLGLPVDLLAGMHLPPSGGTLAVGGETWTFESAELRTWQMPMRGGVTEYQMELVDQGAAASLKFVYDLDARRAMLARVERAGAEEDVADGTCELRGEIIGKRDPRTTVVELEIACDALAVPGLGVVRVEGTVIVDRLEFPV